MCKSEKTKKVVIDRHRFVLDWFEIDRVEIEIKRDQFFEFNYRFGGDWYLAQHDHDGKEYVRKNWGATTSGFSFHMRPWLRLATR